MKMALDWGCPPNSRTQPRKCRCSKAARGLAPNFPQAAKSPDGVDNLTIPSGFFKGLDRWIQQLGQLGRLGTCSTLHVPCMYIAWHISWPIPWNIPVYHIFHQYPMKNLHIHQAFLVRSPNPIILVPGSGRIAKGGGTGHWGASGCVFFRVSARWRWGWGCIFRMKHQITLW